MLFETIGRLLGLILLASAPFQAIEPSLTKDVSQAPGPASVAKAGCTIQLLTDPEGADFNPYLREVYVSVKKRWFANMPPSTEKGEQGMNSIEFRVLKDGNVMKDSLKITAGSGKSDLDAASLQAVREASPFSHLPEKFTQAFVELRFTFYYNLPLPQK